MADNFTESFVLPGPLTVARDKVLRSLGGALNPFDLRLQEQTETMLRFTRNRASWSDQVVSGAVGAALDGAAGAGLGLAYSEMSDKKEELIIVSIAEQSDGCRVVLSGATTKRARKAAIAACARLGSRIDALQSAIGLDDFPGMRRAHGSELEAIRIAVDADEAVYRLFSAKSPPAKGTQTVAVTDRRVLLVQFGRPEVSEDIRLDDVAGARHISTSALRGGAGQLELEDGTERRFSSITHGDAELQKSLFECILDAANARRLLVAHPAVIRDGPTNETLPKAAPESLGDKLRELAVLLEEGLLTDDEFQSAKAQLIARL